MKDTYQQAVVEILLRKYPPFKQRPRHLLISQRVVEEEEIEKSVVLCGYRAPRKPLGIPKCS